MSEPIYSPGLEGVIAGETAVSTIEGGLRYRGYPVGELAERCTFDEVAYLLLYGELPTAKELAQFQSRVAAARRLPLPLRELLQALPKWTPPLDALRSAVSVLAHFDQDAADNGRDANLRKAERLLAQIPVAVADHYRFSKGLQAVPARQDLPHAANFLYMLRAAGGVATVEQWTKDALARKERIMGFGHRVYKHGDVRAGILKTYARAAAEKSGTLPWEDTADVIERVMAAEKNMFPNLDWPAGRLYHALGLDIPIYTPIFALSRVAGWSAHVIEQLDHNRLIRPR